MTCGSPLTAAGLLALVLTASGFLVRHAAMIRYERDVNRIAFNDNWELLDDIRKRLGMVSDSLEQALEAAPAPPGEQPFIVVSIEERRLWYKQGDETIFTTRVATGSGKTLVKDGGVDEWKFETPRGKLVVQGKEIDPVWVPPDWHFIEFAKRRGLGVKPLKRGESLPTPDGGAIAVDGNDVVKQYADGRTYPLESGEGREIVAAGNVVDPPVWDQPAQVSRGPRLPPAPSRRRIRSSRHRQTPVDRPGRQPRMCPPAERRHRLPV